MQPRRQRLRGNRHRKGDGHEERDAVAQPAGVDADRPSSRLVDAFEELEHVLHADDPERADRQDQPEAIHEHASDAEGEGEGERIDGSDRALHSVESDDQQDEAGDHLDDLPDPHLTNTDEDLRILRLRERIVERPLLHVLHQQLHVRLDERVDEAAEQDLDAE